MEAFEKIYNFNKFDALTALIINIDLQLHTYPGFTNKEDVKKILNRE